MHNSTSGLIWQEAISSLDDEKFFEMMRLYLGKIKTPFNRQRLIAQLVSFLKTEENYSSIIALLDEFDIKILSALGFIPNATEEILISFFASDYSVVDILSELSNLQERLIIFYEKDEYSDKKFIRFNPFLQDKLEPFVNINNILCKQQVVYYSLEDNFCVSAELICALVSFIKIKGCSFKNDGTLRKGDLNRISEAFPGKEECIELLIKSLFNLSLLVEGEKSFIVDDERFELFSQLPFNHQMALICTASCSRLGREGLKKEAQLYLDVLSSIPESGYTVSSITKLAFLAAPSQTQGSGSKSRFSRILDAARQENSLLSENSGPIIERIVDSAISFGFLQLLGKNDDGVPVYSVHNSLKNSDCGQRGQAKKVLNIDSTFTVSLMPGLNLGQLLPLTDFIVIKNFGIVSEYEITRQSITNAFDKNWTPESIFKELAEYTNYECPQNLKMSVEDWYNSFLSARIYQGYVLKVTESNISFVENNPRIKKYIKEKLAEGIYLLNVSVTDDISTFVSESGLDFMGKIRESNYISEKLNYPVLSAGHAVCIDFDKKGTEINFSKANELLSGLKERLKTMDVEENQRESLEYRIHQRLILTTSHLETTSVRTEILEAEGMDYSAKVFLLEAAIKNNDKVEISLPVPTGKNEYFTIVGKPLSITKQPADAILRLEVYSTNDIQNVVVSRITHLKRLRF